MWVCVRVRACVCVCVCVRVCVCACVRVCMSMDQLPTSIILNCVSLAFSPTAINLLNRKQYLGISLLPTTWFSGPCFIRYTFESNTSRGTDPPGASLCNSLIFSRV